jgi:hypothetical protein
MDTHNPPNNDIGIAHHMRSGSLFAVKLICDAYNTVYTAFKGNWRFCDTRRANQAGRSFLDIKLFKFVFPGLFAGIINRLAKVVTSTNG